MAQNRSRWPPKERFSGSRRTVRAVMLVNVCQAVALLDRGEVVAIPTETVYGLAADAQNPDALNLLYQTKGRPSEHPVILHVADLEMCLPYVLEVAPAARALMEAFWPGPLTLLLPKSELVSPRITGGRPLVGVRAPAAPLAQQVLRQLGRPLVAPSANRFGHISPTTAVHVEEEFEGRVAVLDGGPCEVGLESTIVAVEPHRVVVLRPGQLSLAALSSAAGLPVTLPEGVVMGVPGALKSHYAPQQPVRLVAAEDLARAAQEAPETVAVIAITSQQAPWPKVIDIQQLPDHPDGYAQRLYAALRRAENSGCREILVEAPPEGDEWSAIRDRLERASA